MTKARLNAIFAEIIAAITQLGGASQDDLVDYFTANGKLMRGVTRVTFGKYVNSLTAQGRLTKSKSRPFVYSIPTAGAGKAGTGSNQRRKASGSDHQHYRNIVLGSFTTDWLVATRDMFQAAETREALAELMAEGLIERRANEHGDFEYRLAPVEAEPEATQAPPEPEPEPTPPPEPEPETRSDDAPDHSISLLLARQLATMSNDMLRQKVKIEIGGIRMTVEIAA